MYRHIHAIGDSHVLHMGRLFVPHHICDDLGQGATAHNLISEDSTTHSKQKLETMLGALDPCSDTLLLSFGEVDCRLHVRSEEGISDTLARYTEAITGIVQRGFRVIVHGVIGAVPQDNTWRQPDYPDAKTRGAIVLSFNDGLRAWCEDNGIEFFNAEACGEDGVLLDGYTDDGVHVNHRAVPAYRRLAESIGGTDEFNAVWCTAGMAYYGQLISQVLGWQLFVDAPVFGADCVYIIGMYDPPTYAHTLDMTKDARRRIIHWCGSDVYGLVRPDFLPEATHLCEGQGLADALHSRGVSASVVPFPTTISPEVTPLPDEPVVNVYLGSNPSKYGESTVRALAEAMPDVKFRAYTFGQYGSDEMYDVINHGRVYLRLVYPDGSANSAREYMQAGRRAVTAVDLPYAKRIVPDDLPGIISALRAALRHTEPDYEAAAFYHSFNSIERYLDEVREHL